MPGGTWGPIQGDCPLICLSAGVYPTTLAGKLAMLDCFNKPLNFGSLGSPITANSGDNSNNSTALMELKKGGSRSRTCSDNGQWLEEEIVACVNLGHLQGGLVAEEGSSGLGGGAIAAIVLTILLVIGVVVFVYVRRLHHKYDDIYMNNAKKIRISLVADARMQADTNTLGVHPVAHFHNNNNTNSNNNGWGRGPSGGHQQTGGLIPRESTAVDLGRETNIKKVALVPKPIYRGDALSPVPPPPVAPTTTTAAKDAKVGLATHRQTEIKREADLRGAEHRKTQAVGIGDRRGGGGGKDAAAGPSWLKRLTTKGLGGRAATPVPVQLGDKPKGAGETVRHARTDTASSVSSVLSVDLSRNPLNEGQRAVN